MPVPALRPRGVRRTFASLLALAAVLPAAQDRAGAAPAPRPAAAAWLVDAPGRGGLLAGRAVDVERPVASLTKLMTARLVLRSGRLDELTVTRRDATSVGESEVPLRPGERQTVRDLLAALVVRSANDAAAALADAVAGSQPVFVEQMNEEAQRLGLRHTHYETPYGLDAPGQYSSARDVLALSLLDMRDPLFRADASSRVASIPGHVLATRNTLLGRYAGLDGVKTGHTDEAGWNLSASASRNGIRLFVVVLGSPDEARRDADVARLLDWGFDRFHAARLVRRGQPAGVLAEPYTGRRVPVVAAAGVLRTVRPAERFVERISLPSGVDGRIERGQRVGTLRLLERGRRVATVPLRAAAAAPAPALVDELRWGAGREWRYLALAGALAAASLWLVLRGRSDV